MVSFPFCKINLGLHVLARRQDGYHNIETCFFPVPWTDVLEIIPGSHFRFTVTGISLSGNQENNSCVAAWKRLANDHRIPPVEIALHKIIPAGAGLGGGSSDGAFALLALNKVFNLGLSNETLSGYAAQLGSDCPFFIKDSPMIGTGKGDALRPISLSLKGKFLVIVKPDIHVPTPDAYRWVVPSATRKSIEGILQEPIRAWKDLLVNDFEESVFRKYPAIGAIKEKLYACGAVYACMSGSGASVFALFDHPAEIVQEFPAAVCWSGFL